MKRAFCEQQFNAQHTDYLRRFPAADYLVIQDGRGPAGRLYVDRSSSDLHLIDVSLHPAHQGRGLGSALLRVLQELAAQRGGGVTLNVALDNHRAASLYARLGFHPEGDGPTHRTLRWIQPPP
nr:GNAT family N-acetyltransferase [Azospirillum soli]